MTTTIYMSGDSTAAHKEADKRPETGWFEKLGLFLPDDITTKNYAFNGASTKTFLKKGKLDQIDANIKENDYLLIQFGHNDQKVETPDWGTTLDEYQHNLQKLVDTAKRHNAIPVILSSIVRRKFDGPKLINSLGKYPEVAHKVASDNNITFIDLNTITYDALQKLGPEKGKSWYLNVNHSKNYPNGVHDNTHLNPDGATTIAHFVAVELSKSNLPIAKRMKL